LLLLWLFLLPFCQVREYLVVF